MPYNADLQSWSNVVGLWSQGILPAEIQTILWRQRRGRLRYSPDCHFGHKGYGGIRRRQFKTPLQSVESFRHNFVRKRPRPKFRIFSTGLLIRVSAMPVATLCNARLRGMPIVPNQQRCRRGFFYNEAMKQLVLTQNLTRPTWLARASGTSNCSSSKVGGIFLQRRG